MTITIDNFSGEHAFLSNFSASAVMLGGLPAKTVEHAYQAAKAKQFDDRIHVLSQTTAGHSKKAGRRVEMRDDWESIKFWVMEDLLRQKFAKPPLRKKLLDTGMAVLIEGNTWGDRTWGVCDGHGDNHLGRLLMEIRSDTAAAHLTEQGSLWQPLTTPRR
jgi:ribA/ribD-fused uncharacterized protein